MNKIYYHLPEDLQEEIDKILFKDTKKIYNNIITEFNNNYYIKYNKLIEDFKYNLCKGKFHITQKNIPYFIPLKYKCKNIKY